MSANNVVQFPPGLDQTRSALLDAEAAQLLGMAADLIELAKTRMVQITDTYIRAMEEQYDGTNSESTLRGIREIVK